jgi:hypothetical protein
LGAFFDEVDGPEKPHRTSSAEQNDLDYILFGNRLYSVFDRFLQFIDQVKLTHQLETARVLHGAEHPARRSHLTGGI